MQEEKNAPLAQSQGGNRWGFFTAASQDWWLPSSWAKTIGAAFWRTQYMGTGVYRGFALTGCTGRAQVCDMVWDLQDGGGTGW